MSRPDPLAPFQASVRSRGITGEPGVVRPDVTREGGPLRIWPTSASQHG